jgi:hypothetical protein
MSGVNVDLVKVQLLLNRRLWLLLKNVICYLDCDYVRSKFCCFVGVTVDLIGVELIKVKKYIVVKMSILLSLLSEAALKCLGS